MRGAAQALADRQDQAAGDDEQNAIEQELRRRGADRTRPQYELDYIGRLLQQF